MKKPVHKYLFLLNIQVISVLLLAFIATAVNSARADVPLSAVLYPDIREPFRSVFTTIVEGVSEAIDGPVLVRVIQNDETPESIETWLRTNGVSSTVVLGSRGQALSEQLSRTTPVVIGAVHMSSELWTNSYYGIALNPDPSAMFKQLKVIAPSVERVHIVYHREREQWLIDMAKPLALKHGLTLNPVPVDTLQNAANSYMEVLRDQKSRTEALWLSQDSAILDEQAVLPMILKESWDNKLIVFSSNPSHVRRGVLFALYPDNQRMGSRIGALLMELHEYRAHGRNSDPTGMRMLDALHTAFNVRTAGRLGIRYTREDLSGFDLVFPPL